MQSLDAIQTRHCPGWVERHQTVDVGHARRKIQSTQLGTSGSIVNTRNDFTRSMVNFLNGAADEMVAADTNADGAALLALQARQQLATTTLSLAQGAETSILRLFNP